MGNEMKFFYWTHLCPLQVNEALPIIYKIFQFRNIPDFVQILKGKIKYGKSYFTWKLIFKWSLIDKWMEKILFLQMAKNVSGMGGGGNHIVDFQ